MLINRTQQIDTELRNFNNIFLGNNNANIDPENRWLALYNSTLNLLRIIYVYMGFMLIDFAQININRQVVDNINNQLGINDIIENIPQNNIINNLNDENINNNIINYYNEDN